MNKGMITDEKLDKMLKSALKEEADSLEVSDRVKKRIDSEIRVYERKKFNKIQWVVKGVAGYM